MNIRRRILLNLKNSIGWSTSRRIIVFAVDDYGNVRMANASARNELGKVGLNVNSNRFDFYDALEDEKDLIQLFDTLSSVKDINGRNAVFTAFSVPANIDFERMAADNYSTYHYITLPELLKKLPGYENVFNLWTQGIMNKLFIPEYHGREHLNLRVLMESLKARNHHVLACFENKSYGGFSTLDPHLSYTAAFDFWHFEDNEFLKQIAIDGLIQFENVFGFKATCFNSPGERAHNCLEKVLAEYGIKYIETDILKKEHQGKAKYKYSLNYIGKPNSFGQTYLVRNCVFEPLPGDNLDWVDYCLSQIDICFRWKRPAIISSHRVNFAGHIEPKVRENGLNQLWHLLKEIVRIWPDVEFMTSSELGNIISS